LLQEEIYYKWLEDKVFLYIMIMVAVTLIILAIYMKGLIKIKLIKVKGITFEIKQTIINI